MHELLGFGWDGLLLRLVAGTAIGFSIGLTGVGGGVLVIPALTLLFGLETSVAVGTASLYSFLTKVVATVHHIRLRTIDWRTSGWFLVGAVPANVGVSRFVTATVARLGAGSAAVVSFQHGLKLFIAGVILISCAAMVGNLVRGARCRSSGVMAGGLALYITGHPTLRCLVPGVLGVIVGALIGATSVGGGVLIIPMLIIFLGMSASRTVGTSIFIAVVLTFVTSAVYLFGNQLDYATAIGMALASFVGVPFGSRLSVRMPDRLLKVLVIAVVLVAVALLMLGGFGH